MGVDFEVPLGVWVVVVCRLSFLWGSQTVVFVVMAGACRCII
jgi:hypothetical protein